MQSLYRKKLNWQLAIPVSWKLLVLVSGLNGYSGFQERVFQNHYPFNPLNPCTVLFLELNRESRDVQKHQNALQLRSRRHGRRDIRRVASVCQKNFWFHQPFKNKRSSIRERRQAGGRHFKKSAEFSDNHSFTARSGTGSAEGESSGQTSIWLM